MALYEYSCPGGHRIERWFPMREVSALVFCDAHLEQCPRYYGSIAVLGDDPYRKAWLGETKAADQGRAIDPMAPKDKFEKAHIERATGRVYFGDDYSQLSQDSLDAAKANRDL